MKRAAFHFAVFLIAFCALFAAMVYIVRMEVSPLRDEIAKMKAEAIFLRAEHIADEQVIRAVRELSKKLDSHTRSECE